jgi:antiphage defense system Thoeris ThsB-like protein
MASAACDAAAPSRIFVSYHHDNDRYFYEAFCRLFANRYEITDDASVERTTGSHDAEGIVRQLRANYVSGTEHTIVLCGLRTPWRKFVDWEIKATLDEAHGLIGINLPTNPAGAQGLHIVPGRLYDNLRSGYAVLLQWQQVRLAPELLAESLQQAATRPTHLINNFMPLLRKGG